MSIHTKTLQIISMLVSQNLANNNSEFLLYQSHEIFTTIKKTKTKAPLYYIDFIHFKPTGTI